MLRQIGLLPAGCQPWNSNMIAGTKSKFAYCSTMAVYIYEITSPFQEYKLTSINAEHSKTITSISWHTVSPNLIATSGADFKIVIWDVMKQKVTAQLPNLKTAPSCIDWVTSHDGSNTTKLSFIGEGGVLQSWDIPSGKVARMKHVTCSSGSKVLIFRWHHSKQNTVAFGHLDGSISLSIQNKGRITKQLIHFSEDHDVDDRVILLSWDPLSNDYLLIANKQTGLRLIDCNSGTVITSFIFPSKAVSTCTFSWISSAPGMFLTGDRDNGVLRLWTVGQDQPLENFKVKSTGFNGICVLDTPHKSNVDHSLNISKYIQRKSSQSQVSSHAIPPADVVCTFRDGGIGLYDLLNKKWHFLKEHGHVETIFDCKFKPDDPNKLATASFDGTVKVWAVNNLTAIKTSIGNEGVIYSLSWAPENLNCIVCGTRRNGIFVWDFGKGKVIKRFKEHGQFAVFCVAWNQRDSHCIASGSEDSQCIVRRLDGKKVQQYSHPASVYGCEWNIFDKNLLATGCEDGIARIWDVSNIETSSSVHELKGHAAKVFHIRWHPLIKDILCTGSDDFTIRIWNIKRESGCYCMGVLAGHTAKVRGLMWNYEIPHMLISGSWDSTIRVWDGREDSQKCLEVVTDHGADVYGLTSHPSTPFLLASSSRDSTVRLWTFAPLLTLLFTKVIAGHSFSELVSTPTECMKTQSDLRLAGKMSTQVVNALKQKQKTATVKYRWFSELFCANPALENLWDITCHVAGMKEGSLSSEYKSGILHVTHLTKYKAAEAQEWELSAMNNSQSGNRLQETALDKALLVHLKLGNLQRHCEILKLLGRWETALSLAPGVSLEYWRLLASEYVNVLHKFSDSQSLSYQIALGDSVKCIQDLIISGDYEDALVVAQSALEDHSPPFVPIDKSQQNSFVMKSNRVDNEDSKLENLKSDCILNLSRMKYLDGDPCRAATYFISNNDTANAIKCLVYANELLLAFCIGQVLKDYTIANDLIVVAELLSRKLEGQKYYFFAIEILKLVTSEDANNNDWSILHASCARYDGDESHRENLYKYAGIHPPGQYSEQGTKHFDNGETMLAMNCFLLSSNKETGLQIGLNQICLELKKKDWSVTSNSLIQCEAVFCISSTVLTRPNMISTKNKLLAISSYFGALKAIYHGYYSVVAPLFEHAVAMTERFELMSQEIKDLGEVFPLESSDIKKDLRAWKKYILQYDQVESGKHTKVMIDEELNEILQKSGVKSLDSDTCETVVAGSNFPSHSDVHISSLTNKRIRGPVFCLEDGTTIISLNEAIMWARVNQFSPTGSGERILPF